jgi:hypothetical protein
MSEPLEQALSQLTPVLEALGIRYAVVGSLASSAQGMYRATADGDLLVALAPGQATRLINALGRVWYGDADMAERSIRNRRSFNLIHIPTAQKIDIFPATSDFHATQMERAAVIPVFPNANAMRFSVASPEDVLLGKLEWYRAGGEVSDRQWNDITGILATNPALDFAYTRTWAARLCVEDLLDRAIADVQRDQA